MPRRRVDVTLGIDKTGDCYLKCSRCQHTIPVSLDDNVDESLEMFRWTCPRGEGNWYVDKKKEGQYDTQKTP